MQTIKQIRTEFYNTIINDVALQNLIDDRLYWINRVATNNIFPLITYKFFETNGMYTFDPTGVNRVGDDVIIQTDIYVEPGEIEQMDDIVEALKVALNAIGYRNINAPIEFFEADINKNVRPMRWERFNV